MRSAADRPRILTALALCAFGFALTIFVFDPGVMTLDARYVYNDIAKNFLGDWQSPVMTVLWRAIDPVAPGPRSIFLLTAGLYWLAFGLIAATLAHRSWLALAVPLLALSPPAFLLVGIIWRDVLFAATWMLAAALAFACHRSETLARRLAQALALALLVLGILLRPNAIPAAPVLAAYILWPQRWDMRRAALLYLPAFAVLVAIVPAIYYGALGATRQHPLHALLVFDLGGITHLTKENQFPVTWTPSEAELITGRCYQPDKWDWYWYLEPCKFVMAKLEGEERVFGTPALSAAWRRAVMQHPFAYLQHRASFMTSFLAGTNLVMWTHDIERPGQVMFPDRPAFAAILAIHNALRPTWLFRSATWLVLCLALLPFGWRQRATPAGAFVLGVCGSAVIFVAAYFFVGVASDYRYCYFAVLAGLAGGAVMLTDLVRRRADSVGGNN